MSYVHVMYTQLCSIILKYLTIKYILRFVWEGMLIVIYSNKYYYSAWVTIPSSNLDLDWQCIIGHNAEFQHLLKKLSVGSFRLSFWD